MTPTPSQDSAPPPRLSAFAWYWVPVLLYLLVIFAGSSVSGPPQIPGGLSDKTAHFLEYAGLGFLLARAIAGRRWLAIPLRYVVVAAIVAAAYGVSDEVHQLFVPGREFDPHDMAADAFGASAAAGALWACGIIRRSSAGKRNQESGTRNQDSGIGIRES